MPLHECVESLQVAMHAQRTDVMPTRSSLRQLMCAHGAAVAVECATASGNRMERQMMKQGQTNAWLACHSFLDVSVSLSFDPVTEFVEPIISVLISRC